jgi:aminoglycoside phosphotransferase (APT) family kinase protein
MSGTDSIGLDGYSHLLRYDETYFRRWPERAQSVLAMSKGDSERQARLHRLTGHYGEVVDRLVSLPVTFVHGEFFASNVLVQRQSGGLRVAPIDWEMAGVGPGLIDLAALVSGGWTASLTAEIARAYYGALTAAGGVGAGWAEFLECLDCCRIHVAMQLAGWSAGWSPPNEHARDWLNDALNIAADLGLC